MEKGYIYAIFSAILFGSAGLFVKLVYVEGLDSISLLTLQYIMASLIMFAILYIKNGRKLVITPSDLKHMAVMGVAGNTGMTICYYKAFSYLPLPLVAILLYSYPIMIFLYKTTFKRESISWKQIIALVLAFLGCILVLGLYKGNLEYSYIGILFGVLSALFYSFMNIYTEEKLEQVEPLAINAFSTFFSLVSLIIIKFPGFLFTSTLSVKLVTYTLILSVFCEIIPLTLLYSALKYIGSVKVSIIGNLEIPTAMILSAYILKKPVSFVQLLGTILVIFAVYILKNNMD